MPLLVDVALQVLARRRLRGLGHIRQLPTDQRGLVDQRRMRNSPNSVALSAHRLALLKSGTSERSRGLRVDGRNVCKTSVAFKLALTVRIHGGRGPPLGWPSAPAGTARRTCGPWPGPTQRAVARRRLAQNCKGWSLNFPHQKDWDIVIFIDFQ